MKNFKAKHIMVLIAMCGVIGAVLGLVTNVAGLFFEPVATEFGIGKGEVSMTLTICNLCFALGGMLTPKLVKEKSFRMVLIICMAILAGSTALLSTAGNITLMYVFSALRGLSAGTIGMVFVTTVINHWFNKNTALMTSIAMGFSGIASAVLSPILSSIIQSSGWRVGYLVAAIMTVIFVLPSILLPIGLTPEAAGTEAYGEKTVQNVSETKTEAPKVTLSLFLLAAVSAVIAAYMTSMPQHFPGLVSSLSMNTAIGASMLSACMLANTGGKIVLGTMIDRFGTKISLTIYGVLVAIGIVCTWLIHTPLAMNIGAILFGLGYGMAAVGTAIMTRDIFTDANYGNVYPKISLCTTVANAIGSSLIGFLFDMSGSYTSTLLMMLVMMGLYLFILQVMYKKKLS
ncbi:MAG: MFS transporter [Solobacterium sp.]|nr:MFS transporter [Solobacterium sp.]